MLEWETNCKHQKEGWCQKCVIELGQNYLDLTYEFSRRFFQMEKQFKAMHKVMVKHNILPSHNMYNLELLQQLFHEKEVEWDKELDELIAESEKRDGEQWEESTGDGP